MNSICLFLFIIWVIRLLIVWFLFVFGGLIMIKFLLWFVVVMVDICDEFVGNGVSKLVGVNFLLIFVVLIKWILFLNGFLGVLSKWFIIGFCFSVLEWFIRFFYIRYLVNEKWFSIIFFIILKLGIFLMVCLIWFYILFILMLFWFWGNWLCSLLILILKFLCNIFNSVVLNWGLLLLVIIFILLWIDFCLRDIGSNIKGVW